jgi:putative chitinase
MVQVAAVATIAVETPNFLPTKEKYASGSTPEQYFGRMYWQNREVAHRLGNLSLQDAIDFPGRGLIQITGRDNYELYAELLGVPLDTKPELALQPAIAAEILAAYFKRRGVADAANAKDWFRVRVRVNGGTNGWPRFMQVINAALEAV